MSLATEIGHLNDQTFYFCYYGPSFIFDKYINTKVVVLCCELYEMWRPQTTLWLYIIGLVVASNKIRTCTENIVIQRDVN